MKLIGVLGGGQLGRMLGLAGIPLGCNFRFYDENPESPAAAVGQLIDGSFHDLNGIKKFAESLDIATYEFENVPVSAVEELEQYLRVFPGSDVLRTAQDRVAEKTLFTKLNIPTPDFIAVDSDRRAREAVEKLGCPVVFKTTRLGYDGKGQLVIRSTSDAVDVWTRLGKVPLIAEAFVPFERELSIVACRDSSGAIVFYPLTQNIHTEGILRLSLAPAQPLATSSTNSLQHEAEQYARRIMESFNYVGTLALELFQVGSGLVANEIAPRVHNSGHWTIDGATVSQFENHVRALLGYPLGVPALRGSCAMINLVGELPEITELMQEPTARVHLYGKTPRAGRKLGHVNIVAESSTELEEVLRRLKSLLPSEARACLPSIFAQ